MGYVITDNGANMVKAFRDCFEEFDFCEELTLENSLTTSGGNINQETAGDYLGITEEIDELPTLENALYHGEDFNFDEAFQVLATVPSWTYLRCIAHSLQLAALNSIKAIPEVKALCASEAAVIRFIRKSHHHTTMRESCGKALIIPCKTRWNTFVTAIDRLTEVLCGFKWCLISLSMSNFDRQFCF